MHPSASPRPWLTEVVDARTGVVRASGHLTIQGADLLRGTVETLRSQGHPRVVLDLSAVSATDDEGMAQIGELCRDVAAGRGRLVVRRPAGSAA